jgi:hypothetical protein
MNIKPSIRIIIPRFVIGVFIRVTGCQEIVNMVNQVGDSKEGICITNVRTWMWMTEVRKKSRLGFMMEVLEVGKVPLPIYRWK